MYCPKCGQEVGEYTRICPACGELLESTPVSQPQSELNNSQQPQPAYQNSQQPQPNYGNSQQPQPNNYQQIPVIPDYKVQSILLIVFSAICCFQCIPIVSLAFAIVALVTSSKIPQHISAGNIDLAQEASRKTKMWCWISLGILILSILLSVISYIVILSSPEYQNMLEEIMNMYQYEY